MCIGLYICRMQQERPETISVQWSKAWQDNWFRIRFMTVCLVTAVMLVSLPAFFRYIEQRNGIQLEDPLLQLIPSADVSIPTFLIIWSISLMVFIRGIQQPYFMLFMLGAFTLLGLSRIVSITLVPLEPPVGLITLKDPLTGVFYGGTDVFITKDLFYSGHTSNMFLMYLCLSRKRDKQLALLAACTVAVLVLVQHVHYTLDVLAAFVFTYFIFRLSKNLLHPTQNASPSWK